jgi:hypothetical protein
MAFKDRKRFDVLPSVEDEVTATLLGKLEDGSDEVAVYPAWRTRIWTTRWYIAALVVSNIATLFGTMDYARSHYSPDFPAQGTSISPANDVVHR